MAIAYKHLATVIPAVTTKTIIYTAPAAKQTIISSLVVTATFSSGSQIFSLYALSTSGETQGTASALGLNLTISANSVVSFTEGWTLNAGETLAVVCGTSSGLNFNLFGIEIG